MQGEHLRDPDAEGLPVRGGGEGPRDERAGEGEAAGVAAEGRRTFEGGAQQGAEGEGTLCAEHDGHRAQRRGEWGRGGGRGGGGVGLGAALLKDDERLKVERSKALKAKERFAQNTTGIGRSGGVSGGAVGGRGGGSGGVGQGAALLKDELVTHELVTHELVSGG